MIAARIVVIDLSNRTDGTRALSAVLAGEIAQSMSHPSKKHPTCNALPMMA
jgi:hypothetical protein